MSRQKPVERAAAEVLAGDPRASARAWLWPLALAATILFALDTYLVATRPLLPFDVPVATFVQSLPWGPLTYVFDAIDLTAGYVQVAVGVAAVLLLFLVERRAGYLMAIGSISSLLDNWIKLLMARQRPTADLVHILTPAPGFSFPSGHAVFFTWLSFMLAFSLAPHVRPSRRWALWWSAFVVWLPERWLPNPSLRWFGARGSKTLSA